MIRTGSLKGYRIGRQPIIPSVLQIPPSPLSVRNIQTSVRHSLNQIVQIHRGLLEDASAPGSLWPHRHCPLVR